jgi:3'-phosphoadenosine 5'-phosphosulfate synthase
MRQVSRCRQRESQPRHTRSNQVDAVCTAAYAIIALAYRLISNRRLKEATQNPSRADQQFNVTVKMSSIAGFVAALPLPRAHLSSAAAVLSRSAFAGHVPTVRRAFAPAAAATMTAAAAPVPTQISVDSLVETLVPEKERPARKAEAAGLEAVSVSDVDRQWVHVLSEGWASPLKGFMREDEYLQTLHFNSIRQPDGSVTNMSVPIVLAITDADKTRIEGKNAFTLKGPDGTDIAILRNFEIYKHNKEERCARTFGLTDARHPYAEIIYNSGDYLVGGDIEVLEPIVYGDGLDEYRLTPRQLREEYKRRNADAIFVFQLRNPIHNGHALLMTSCREELMSRGFKNPVLLVHQIGGKVKGDDIPLATRILQNTKVLAEGVLDPATTILGIFPSPMLYGGPTEVQWHAKARMNAGCSYYIVGRDPAG